METLKMQTSQPITKCSTLILFLVLFLFGNCGEGSFRKDPFAITIARYENRSLNNVFLAHAGDPCSVLFHKRIHNALFLYPMNGFSQNEIADMANQKMIRFRNVIRMGDLFCLYPRSGFFVFFRTWGFRCGWKSRCQRRWSDYFFRIGRLCAKNCK